MVFEQNANVLGGLEGYSIPLAHNRNFTRPHVMIDLQDDR